MELPIRTFCLICIVLSVSTKLSFSENLDGRDSQPHIHSFPTGATNQTLQENDQDHNRIVRHESDRWESERTKRHQNNYPRESYSRSNRIENDSNERRTSVLRTYGRGTAKVTTRGQTVNVPNEYGRHGYRRAMESNGSEKNENETKLPRHRGVCRECPTDQTVVVSKGNTFVILPEPCQQNAKMWNHHSGPRPGSKIREGVHTIRGYIGPKKRFCQYNYQVIVRQCSPLKGKEDTTIKCSAENFWGSVCNVSCTSEKEPVGPTELECKEDLTWSNPVPTCKSKTDCATPKVKAKSKISCKTADMTEVEGDFLPNGSTCKFRQNEKDVAINCKDGRWRVIRKNKSSSFKKVKQQSKTKPEKKDPCSSNPCQNGGTCLRSESMTGPPICKCRPQTRGLHCEMRECYYNICENDGLCFFQNEERICYCTPEYSGDTCQHYTPQ